MKTIHFKLFLFLITIFCLSSCELLDTGDLDNPDNPTQTTVEITEDILTSTTWKEGYTYIIDGTIRVGAEQMVTLTIEKGVTVMFTEGSQLDIAYWDDHYASVKALGTADDPILFTSKSPSPAKGDWETVAFYNSALDCTFEYCIFEYGGSYEYHGMVYVEECKPAFSNCVFSNSETHGLRLGEEGEFSKFESNIITNVTNYLIYLHPAAVHTIGVNNTYQSDKTIFIDADYDLRLPGDFTWKNQGVAYTLDGTMRVGDSQGTKLVIEAGTELRFMDGAVFDIGYWDADYAQLVVNGTVAAPVVFTSNSPYPEKGDWEGINFNKGVSGSVINYAQIKYAGSYEYYGAVSFTESGFNTVEINNTLISDSYSYGITVDNESSVDISTVTFLNNTNSDYYIR